MNLTNLAISEHERQTKVIEDQKKQIARLEARNGRAEHDMDILRRECQGVRQENAQLRSELASVQGGANGTYHAPQTASHSHNYGVQPSEPQSQLPPLRSIQGPESMNGVQYQHDQRTNGYRNTAERYA
jgi:hypothetical protein